MQLENFWVESGLLEACDRRFRVPDPVGWVHAGDAIDAGREVVEVAAVVSSAVASSWAGVVSLWVARPVSSEFAGAVPEAWGRSWRAQAAAVGEWWR